MMTRFDIEQELTYMLKIAYKIGHKDARYDACDLIKWDDNFDKLDGKIMNVKSRCKL